CQKYTSSPLTF
nr:immunoglobulin light chain junction region [Macaca mulatta]MOX47935.1 immunoglobulin light chain junction region [Macaca mulatta]MOX48422.1 immunoglobulin light chain junction region [Macaca mulatta]MOX50710.1 immunoglobulin light chain junction region [Macaca mulatta]